MPIRSLIRAMGPQVPEEVTRAGEALKYRDFLTVALIIDTPDLFPDHGIYIHDADLWAVNGDAKYLEEVSEERLVPRRVSG